MKRARIVAVAGQKAGTSMATIADRFSTIDVLQGLGELLGNVHPQAAAHTRVPVAFVTKPAVAIDFAVDATIETGKTLTVERTQTTDLGPRTPR